MSAAKLWSAGYIRRSHFISAAVALPGVRAAALGLMSGGTAASEGNWKWLAGPPNLREWGGPTSNQKYEARKGLACPGTGPEAPRVLTSRTPERRKLRLRGAKLPSACMAALKRRNAGLWSADRNRDGQRNRFDGDILPFGVTALANPDRKASSGTGLLLTALVGKVDVDQRLRSPRL
jgi:hypothetical protein